MTTSDPRPVEALLTDLDEAGRTPLARLPTPLEPAPRLAAALGTPGLDLRLKRDDETGFALGGNKVRKLEHALAPDALEGVTRLVTCGGPQSNHCRVTAGAAARLGLYCTLVVNGEAPDPPTGNALLHRLFGARIRTVEDRDEREPTMEAAAREEEERGGRALALPLGASTPRGALGYVRAAAELHRQLPPSGARRIWIWIASSSCGTLAGLLAGFQALGRADVALVGVSADEPATRILARSRQLAAGALELLERPAPERWIHLEARDDQIGEGYGAPTPDSREATELLATREGVVLDPVYTSKAAAGLVAWIRAGGPAAGDRVVFWHTGGHPALFR